MDSAVVLHMRVNDIVIGDRRPVGDLTEMIASIREVGLLNPITVNEDNTLIAGRHRLEACKALGWEEIPVLSVRMDELHAELAEIDENLVNNPPGTLERSELWKRRKEIYEALHPEATAEAIRSAARWEAEKSPNEIISLGDDAKPPAKAVISFSKDAAAKTGVSQRTVQQEVQIAENIVPEVKEMLRNTPVADKKTDLLAIARTPGEQQQAEALARMAQAQTKREMGEAAYRAQRKAMREEREREEAEAAGQEQMVEERADVDGVFARNRMRQDFRNQYKDASEFFRLKPEAFLPLITDADRTNLDAFVLMVRRWCNRVEALRKPHLQVVGGERHVEIR